MRTLFLTFLITLLSFSTMAEVSKMQRKMVNTLSVIEEIFDTVYAPTQWKSDFANWKLEVEIDRAKERVLGSKEISVKEFQVIVRDFFNSTLDYHVGISFHAREKASLPFFIKRAEERYFFTYINRKSLSKESFPFKPGDELVSFDGRPIQEVIDEMKLTLGNNTAETSQALAEFTLVSRRAGSAVKVPKGPVTLAIKRKGEERVVEHQIAWKYTPESIHYDSLLPPIDSVMSNFSKLVEQKDHYRWPMMTSQVALELSDRRKSDGSDDMEKFLPGGRKSFVPELGKKIWESDSENPFHAYMYLDEKKRVIGYVRIPSYMAGEKESKAFAAIVKKFDEFTDAMVIDEINNPGGSVFYLYSLVSMLTDTAITTPRHRMSLNAYMVDEALKYREQLKKITTDEEAVKYFKSETVGGYPVDMTFVDMVRANNQFVIDQWNEGKTLSDPYHIWGVDKINPHREVQYTKPVLVLINELCFSGGDFFPAILQDNERVKVFGTRTAEAGGYVLSQDIPNIFGLKSFSLTGSLAERVDGNPIENLGVTPDIEYQLSAKDLQEGFAEYKKAIQQAISSL